MKARSYFSIKTNVADNARLKIVACLALRSLLFVCLNNFKEKESLDFKQPILV